MLASAIVNFFVKLTIITSFCKTKQSCIYTLKQVTSAICESYWRLLMSNHILDEIL